MPPFYSDFDAIDRELMTNDKAIYQNIAHLAQMAWRAFPGRRRVSGGVLHH